MNRVARYNTATTWFVLLTLIYLAQSLFYAPDRATLHKYHIGSGQLRALTLTVVIPYVVIWIIALVGYLRLSAYSESIKDGKDGVAFKTISNGTLWLGLWLPISAVATNLASHIYHSHHSLTATLVILSNYLNLFLLLPAFILVHQGSKKLLAVIKTREYISPKTVVFFIALSVLYSWLALNDPARRVPTEAANTAAYYQSDWLIVLTIIIPRLIMWFLGIQAVHNIYRYMYKVKGPIYKKALLKMANGICGVVIATIVLRMFQSLNNTVGQWSLEVLLVIVYILLLIISVGYIYIAVGAKDLKQIEDI